MEYKVIEPSGKIATMISTEAEGSLPIDDSASGLGQVLTLGNNTQTGEYTFDFTTAHPDAKFITQNNLISFKDKYSKDRLYTITRVEDTGIGTATAYCYDYLLVLINSIADSWDYTGDPHPIAFYVDKLIANTGMQIGINEISNLSRALKFDGESDTYLTRLGDVANQFGGAEVDCSVETDGIRVTGVYINIYKHIGKTTLVQDFITGINLDHTERTIDIDRLRTALKAKGGTPEGENQKPITFADIAYDDGQYYTPKGDPVLYDRINGELWSQTRITNSNKIGWIFDNYSYDTLDPQLLLTHTLTKLKSVNTPEATYTVNSVNFEGDIGDSVRVTDLNYEPELYLKARVSQVNNHYTAQGLDTGVLANYELLRNNIDPTVRAELDKISKLPGKPGKDGKDAVVLNVSSVNGNMFKNTGISTILTVSISVGGSILDTAEKMHAVFGADAYLQWQVKNAGELEFADISLTDTRLSDEGFLFAVSAADVNNKSTFKCELYY